LRRPIPPLTYAVGGCVPIGADKLALVVDGVLLEQIARLEARLER
jgi:hypothetical protein